MDMKNYAEIHMTNAALIDIFSHYADNSALAEIVSEDGSINLKFKLNSSVEPPTCCEHVLSLLFALFESNPESSIGKIYIANQNAILRETVYRLAQVMDSFSDVKISMHSTKPNGKNPDAEITQHTEFTITKTTTKSSK
ncbi:MAG: hypothetical protein J6B01_01610 [Ruminococcus sp.]|nr:hypothetical protein [Ruminococcus sp.]